MLNSVQLEHFRNLISLAAADDRIEEIERITLSKIAYERGIPMDRLNVMLNKASEYKFLIPQNQEDKESQLADMIRLAYVDGEFSKAEYNLIMTVGERLGFSHDEVEKIIKKHSES